MRILVLYGSNTTGQKISSSAKSKLESNPIDNIEIEFVNIADRNMDKYFTKLEKNNILPDIVYLYNDYKELKEQLSSKYYSMIVKLYNDNYMFKPQRVRGNIYKTNVYLLYDKILYDISSSYCDKEVYTVSFKNMDYKKVNLSEFELEHPLGHLIRLNYNIYRTEEEARSALIEKKEKNISSLKLLKKAKEKNIKTLKDEISQLNRQILLESELLI